MREIFSKKQHGAWAILGACFVLGTIAGGAFNIRSVILLGMSVLAYFLYNAVGVVIEFKRYTGKGWKKAILITAVLSVSILLATVVLVVFYELKFVLPIGILIAVLAGISFVFEHSRAKTALAGKITRVVALCTLTPFAAYVSSGKFSHNAFSAWFLAVLFFCGSVFHVRSQLSSKGSEVLSFAYHVLALAAAAIAIKIDLIPVLGLVALIPAILRSAAALIFYSDRPVSSRHLGMTELAYTILFVAISAFALAK